MTLTTAFLLDFNEILPVILSDKSLIRDLSKNSYLLISSVNSEFTKLSIYPIEHEKVLKIIFSGTKLNPLSISQITNIFSKSNLKIIHTSGLVFVRNIYLYEIYLIDFNNEINLIEEKINNERDNFGLDSIEKIWIEKKKKSNN